MKPSVVRSVFFVLLIYLLDTAQAAGNYNTGALYFANADYNTAMQIWAPLAKEGNPAAQYSIGLLYDQGKGVKQDPVMALKYFKAAVKQNLPAAEYYLGVKYYAGLGVKKDYQKALGLMVRAAQQDHLQAQFQLAMFYEQGIGTQKNSPQATQWFIRAAENGFGPAQHSLATRYLTGHDAALNLEKGVFWLQKAAEQNDPDAMRDLGFLYYQGMGVTKDWNRAQELLTYPAEEGSSLAQFLMGEIYAQGGFGVRKNRYQAKVWFSRAKHSGNRNAQQRLTQLAAGKIKISSTKTRAAVLSSHSSGSKKTATKVSSSTTDTQTEDNRQFLLLDSNHYTIQIIQVRKFQSINYSIIQHKDPQTYVLKIIRNNKPFYVLTYGDFASYKEAKKNSEKLPGALQLSSSPWIRKIKQLKALVPADSL